MLAFSSRCTSRIVSVPRFLRTAFAPSGSGKPVSLLPPFAQIDDQLQLLVAVRELPFVNDQARIDRLALDIRRRRPRE